MRLLTARIQDFRNLAWVEADLAEPLHYIGGANGQGKTNLLEALSLITALRSFRTADPRTLPRHDGPGEARLWLQVAHERMGTSTVEIRLGRQGRELLLDGEPVRRLAGYLGLFPTVALAAQDIQLLRGGPQARRRFIDLTLAAVDAGYFTQLSRYHRCLRERNALLRDQAPPAQLRAFNQPLATAAIELIAARQEAVAWFAQQLGALYGKLSPAGEEPELHYQPDAEWTDLAGCLRDLDAAADRDRRAGTTTCGPHRDEFAFRLFRQRARAYASEGQQRAYVLALRLAQWRWFAERTGVQPVLLADDILGELDADRRARFWALLPADLQCLATGTGAPPPDGPGAAWRVWRMQAGKLA
jgi:DNA replication and repair protein RecF